MKFTVRVLVPRPEEDASAQASSLGALQSGNFEVVCVLAVPADPSEDFIQLWERIAERYTSQNYGDQRCPPGLYFSKLQDVDGGDICVSDAIGGLYSADAQICVILNRIDRNSSIPPDSILRPPGFRKRRWEDLSDEEDDNVKRQRCARELSGSALSEQNAQATPSILGQTNNRVAETVGNGSLSEDFPRDTPVIQNGNDLSVQQQSPVEKAVACDIHSPLGSVQSAFDPPVEPFSPAKQHPAAVVTNAADTPRSLQNELIVEDRGRTATPRGRLASNSVANPEGRDDLRDDRSPCNADPPHDEHGVMATLSPTPVDTNMCITQDDIEASPETTQPLRKKRSTSVLSSTRGKHVWTRTEDTIIVRGMVKNWSVNQVAENLPRDSPVERTKSAIRSRRKYLNDAYGSRTSLYQSFPLALQNTGHDGEAAANTQTPRVQKQWNAADKELIRKAVAEGLETTEAREKYFPDRASDAVGKQMRKVFAAVVDEERLKKTWPKPSYPSEPWSDMENLKLRRFHNQGVPFENVARLWSPKRSRELLRRKWKKYHRQSASWRNVSSGASIREEGNGTQNENATEDLHTSSAVDGLSPHGSPAVFDTSQPNPSQPFSSPIRKKTATRQLKPGHVGSQTILNWPRDKGKGRATDLSSAATNSSTSRATRSEAGKPQTCDDSPSAQLSQELAIVASSPKEVAPPASTGRLRHPSGLRTPATKILDLRKSRQINGVTANEGIPSHVPNPSRAGHAEEADEEIERVAPPAGTRRHRLGRHLQISKEQRWASAKASARDPNSTEEVRRLYEDALNNETMLIASANDDDELRQQVIATRAEQRKERAITDSTKAAALGGQGSVVPHGPNNGIDSDDDDPFAPAPVTDAVENIEEENAFDSARITDTMEGVEYEVHDTSRAKPQSQEEAKEDEQIYIYDDNGHLSGSRPNSRRSSSPFVRVPIITPKHAALPKELMPFPSAQVPRERKPPVISAARATTPFDSLYDPIRKIVANFHIPPPASRPAPQPFLTPRMLFGSSGNDDDSDSESESD